MDALPPERRHFETGSALALQGRHAEAIAAFTAALGIRPEWAPPYYLRSFSRLAMGDFQRGWADYEMRLDVRQFVQDAGVLTPEVIRRLQRPPTLEGVTGRRVMLVSEQGIGDQIMFASMIPDLQARTAALTCAIDRRLVRLFANSFPGLELVGVPGQASAAGFDALVALGSLGRLFRNALSDFPGTPYLTPTAEARERAAERLGPRDGRLRVGVSWRGGAARTRQAERSMALAQLEALFALPGCEFVSLQYGDIDAELAAYATASGREIRRLPPEAMHDLDDLAGLVAQMDVTVSVQNALVHLAGAMGAPCLALLPAVAEWRYMSQGRTMPWYGSVELLRQASPGDWIPVVGAAVEALRKRQARP